MSTNLSTKRVVFNTGKLSLSKAEKEVLFLLTQEFLTPKKIQIRRQTSRQATYKIIKSLKQKGAIRPNYLENPMVDKSQPTCQPVNQKSTKSVNQIRLHGQEFNIKILYKDHRYKQLQGKANLINIDGNEIRLYRDSIEIYSGQAFYADTTQKATSKSLEYWNRLIARLENEFKIILLKPRSQNIRIVNQHYAETNNEFAEQCDKKGDKIRIYSNDDGKLWFTIDKSFNPAEAETLHPQTSKQDMGDVIQPHFNDLRDYYNKTGEPPAKISELLSLIKNLAEQNKETAQGVNALATFMKSQLPKINEEPKEMDPREKPDYVG